MKTRLRRENLNVENSMHQLRLRGWFRPGLVLSLAVFSVFCSAGRAQRTAVPQPTKPNSAERLELDFSESRPAAADKLYAQLWMMASPEYRALCLQTYNSALRHVAETAAGAPRVDGKPTGAGGKPLAVVADLDETILDNSGYQARLALAGVEYSRKTWNHWVSHVEAVRLVPGAKNFVERVEELRVTMVYLSNRPDSLRTKTIETLGRLGLPTSGLADPHSKRLLLRVDDSDKETRRREAAAQYEIIAFLGDNLGDFPDVLGRDSEQRLQRLTRFEQLWGTRWFVFPNPSYGDWTRILRDRDLKELLRELLDGREASGQK